MEAVRTLVLGLGNFGRSWAELVLPACRDCAVLTGVVDRDPRRLSGLGDGIRTYGDLSRALEAEQPELVVNATPPDAHYALTDGLLRKGYAVLCEKPIADTLEKAALLGKTAEETGGFLMIGENYRFHPAFREARRALAEEDLGRIRLIQCAFRHFHPDYSRFYHGSLAHPLLEDVTVHHLDLARYLTGEEPVRVWCREYAAEYSWYGRRPATAYLLTAMTGGVVFGYNGTLASPDSSTGWSGTWEIQCDGGVLKIEEDRVVLLRKSGETVLSCPGGVEDTRIPMLREACAALREHRRGETDWQENFRSFRWMREAIRAAETRERVDLSGI